MAITYAGDWLFYLGFSYTEAARITGLSPQGIHSSIRDDIQRPRWVDYLAERMDVPPAFLVETNPFEITWGVAENTRRKMLDWAAAYRLNQYRSIKVSREQLAA